MYVAKLLKKAVTLTFNRIFIVIWLDNTV